ncbi:MAG: RNA methyltransferase [Clostridiales bacterium]|nr:RNA methyltransferase [Clostridiales bacterium]MBQ1743488.1 RNA methyltransferase [Clostridiales bacterium]MBQ2156119.1 RNA methyltransferase [Clostridiales bacterium]MBQ5518605.1 RNA methyltransferase [Clostridiales bacterium]
MNFIEITDINAPELDVFSRITEPQLRTYFEPEIGIFLAETANVIMRAIEAGYEPLSMLVEKERLEAEAGPVFECIEKYCGKEKLISMPVYIAARDIVTQLTGYTLVRGLWMTLRRRPEISVEEFCKDKKRITVLMDVVNPTNVGAIIRSAAALGMDGVLLTHASVDPLTRRSARVSMGTCFQIPWTKATLEQSEGLNLLDILHSYGFKTVAMALTEDSTSIDNDEIRANDKLAVLMGSEGPGLPKEVIAASDYRVMIPMYHGVDSLNVAAASAVAFWELTK